MNGEAEIQVEGLTHRYETREERLLALQDISIAVPRGRFVGLVGPSGCGKSSLLMMMAGLVPPSEGRITIAGHPGERTGAGACRRGVPGS